MNVSFFIKIDSLKARIIIHGKYPFRNRLMRQFSELTIADGGITTELYLTGRHGDAERFASGAAGADIVIACGGDGTNHGVVNGLMQIPADERPAFGFIPCGSGNDFARNFKEVGPMSLIKKLKPGFTTESIDLLHISTAAHQRHALNMITCGIGAEIAATVNRRKFIMPAAFNYYSAIIAWLLRYRAPEIRITSEEQEASGPVFLAAFGNGVYAGHGLGLNPGAVLNDGHMGLTTIGNVGVFDFLRYQGTLKRAEQVQDERVCYSRTSGAHIEVFSGRLAIECDGEPLTILAAGEGARIKNVPGAIRLLA